MLGSLWMCSAGTCLVLTMARSPWPICSALQACNAHGTATVHCNAVPAHRVQRSCNLQRQDKIHQTPPTPPAVPPATVTTAVTAHSNGDSVWQDNKALRHTFLQDAPICLPECSHVTRMHSHLCCQRLITGQAWKHTVIDCI